MKNGNKVKMDFDQGINEIGAASGTQSIQLLLWVLELSEQ